MHRFVIWTPRRQRGHGYPAHPAHPIDPYASSPQGRCTVKTHTSETSKILSTQVQRNGPSRPNALPAQPTPSLQQSAARVDAEAHAEQLRASGDAKQTSQSLLVLQRRYGNQHVQRVVSLSRSDKGESAAVPGQVPPPIEQRIHRARGGGRGLDSGVRAQMESAFATDFSDVRIHTDGEADSLNRSLNARAFTVGSDVFFRSGNYQPGNTSGRELLAHELTHVVQQGGGLQAKLDVSAPDDEYEREADQVARAVIQGQPIQGQPIQRQSEVEDEEPDTASLQAQVQRQINDDRELDR